MLIRLSILTINPGVGVGQVINMIKVIKIRANARMIIAIAQPHPPGANGNGREARHRSLLDDDDISLEAPRGYSGAGGADSLVQVDTVRVLTRCQPAQRRKLPRLNIARLQAISGESKTSPRGTREAN